MADNPKSTGVPRRFGTHSMNDVIVIGGGPAGSTAATLLARRGLSVLLHDPNRAVIETSTGERLEARFVIDASGHGALIGNRIGGKSNVESLKKVAFFAHYRNVPRPPGRDAGNTLIVVLRDAWFWMIPITEELMSVGLVVDREHVKSCGMSPEELLARTIAETPYVANRMSAAERVTQVYARKDFSYAMKRMVGENFALV